MAKTDSTALAWIYRSDSDASPPRCGADTLQQRVEAHEASKRPYDEAVEVADDKSVKQQRNARSTDAPVPQHPQRMLRIASPTGTPIVISVADLDVPVSSDQPRRFSKATCMRCDISIDEQFLDCYCEALDPKSWVACKRCYGFRSAWQPWRC